MDRIRIRGGRRLKGEIPISGAKNAALKLMAASLLTAEPLTLTNVPRLADVRAMAELLSSFGVKVEVTLSGQFGEGDTMRLDAGRHHFASSPPTTWCARCAPASRCWGRCWRAWAKPRCRCPAAAPSGRGRSNCI